FERKDYMGTSKARDFRSHIHLTDPEKNIDLEQEIWMNNPMRYGGKTFYQSSFFPDGSGTVLSVVTNTGWMIPYVSCMIVAVGMFFHFGLTLTRFLRRRTEEEARRAAEAAAKPQRVKGKKRQDEPIAAELVTPALPPRSPFDFIRIGDTRSWVISGAIAMVVTFLLLGYNSRYKDEDMDLKAFGSLPVMYQGRIKPIDTLARNSLKIISNRDYLKINDDEDRVRAVRWLLDLMSQSNGFEDHHVFRIDNPEIKQALNLPKRKGHRYSVNEIRDRLDEYSKLAGESRKVDAKERSLIQRRFVELDNRVRTYTLLMHAFQPTPYPPVPTEQLDEAAEMRFFQTFRALRQQAQQRDAQLGQLEAPLLVPPSDVDEDDTPWLAYSMGADRAYFQRVQGDDINPFTLKLTEILAAYSQGQSGRFNKAVGEYYVLLDRQSPADLEMDKVGFESFYNSFAPFLKAMILNIVAFVIVGFAFLAVSSEAQPGRPKSTWPSFLNRTAFLIIVGSFAIQSIALVSRIYISGRPPVTNLYSSAILIGWAAVLVCILVELLFRYGIGNAIATICGWSTLLIARFLAADGDTFTVLQAVLDTQFWLATHVVCITLGYATTFLAGAFGIFYIFGGFFTKAINKQINREFCRIIYSVLCFSIFFSFVGTVLGGLWADDSWGRFWGWDPKENGALIIVLWNALVLHARWGNMVRDRGMAVLAVGGNIVTAWSWFGVNELGVGLHSYGFTDGVLFVLGVFIMSQLAIIAIGCAPRSKWRSDAFRTT
ncbi:MAG: cytochrome c biogenesis protein CcsA, partial [Pirellulaceae bacterium]|nr:cytochrome c biogenesis protein CcsA [Pirellulaceae bacterium]